ncbi:hypothetical protein ABZP36_011281 [Zizania latifolia]
MRVHAENGSEDARAPGSGETVDMAKESPGVRFYRGGWRSGREVRDEPDRWRWGCRRGRGRGLPTSAPTRAPGSPIHDDSDEGADPFSSPAPVGRGRGEALIPTSPIIPSFSSLPGVGRGRGSVIPTPLPGEVAPKQPTSTKRFDAPPAPGPEAPTAEASSSEPLPPAPPRPLPSSGAGRGVPLKHQPVDSPQDENRFIRRREEKKAKAASPSAPSGRPKLSTEEVLKRAMELLGGGDDGGRGGRGRGGRGVLGRGRGRGRGGRGPADVDYRLGIYLGMAINTEDMQHFVYMYFGDNVDGDRFEKRLGEEKAKIFNQTFEEAADNALPDTMEDAYLDAAHTNNMIEFEPEYHVNFGNPDIEEKPPMSLEEMLQKVKPFIIAYEGIQNQESRRNGR